MPMANASPTDRPTWPPALAVSGWSGSGKTTLIESVVAGLVSDGLRVAVVKHSHHGLQLDTPGKDTDRFFQAGADVLAHDSDQAVLRAHGAASLADRLARLGPGYDLAIVEGHKTSALPKVWVAAEDGSAPNDVSHVVATLAGKERAPERLRAIVDDFLARFHRETPVCAAILIGGKSARMGEPKALLRFEGEPLLARIVRTAEAVAEEVVLVGRAEVPPELADLPRLEDAPGVSGPVAGLLAAMRRRPDARWLALACDMPFARPEAAQWLLDQCGPARWAVAPHCDDVARPEPLFAVYDPPAAVLLEAGARAGERSIQRILSAPRLFSPRVPESLCDAWTNVNTPEAWREATQ